MKIKIGYYLVMVGLLGAGLWAQSSPEEAISAEGKANLGKPRPPRIPDGSYVPKKGMINREKDQFWAGPGEEDRFVQILTLTLVSKEQLEVKLQDWAPYQKFTDAQKARLVERIDEVRVQSRKEALKVAKDFNLEVTSENEDEFVQRYWTEKLALEKAIKDELSPLRKRLEDEAKKRIEKSFKSSVSK